MEKNIAFQRHIVVSATVKRIAILGAESTGKSTLAAALAAQFQTVWVPEYLREFVEVHQRTPHADEQLAIATTQIEREEKAVLYAQRFLFCDTTPILTAIYSDHYFGKADYKLESIATRHTYAATIVTAPTTPWIADGLQRESDTVRQRIHALLIRKLQDNDLPYLLIDGTTQDRIKQVVRLLDQLDND